MSSTAIVSDLDFGKPSEFKSFVTLAGATNMDAVEVKEFSQQIESAISVLDVSKEKIKMAAVLPLFFKDDELMKKTFTNMQIEKLRKYCIQFMNNDDKECATEIDYRLLKAIELAYNNQKARNQVNNLVACLPDDLKNFLHSFYDICNIVEVQLRTSASEEFNRSSTMHSIYQDLLKSKSIASGIRTQITDRESNLQWKLAEKQALITKYNRDLSDRKWLNNVRIQKEILAANRQMNEICLKSESELSKLREEAEKVKKQYQEIRKTNVRAYKKLTEKKTRILAQLTACIKKYDADVGEKIRENEKLEEELAECTDMLEKFTKKFEAQEIEYKTVSAAKDMEEKIAQEEKLMMFMMNRAAKIIQRAWRKYKSKKKKGKGKKGKGKRGRK